MRDRYKYAVIGAGVVGIFLVLYLVSESRHMAVVAHPQKYLTATRASELSAFADRLLHNSSYSQLTVTPDRVLWSRGSVKVDGLINEEETASILKTLRKHHLQFLRVDKKYGSVEYACYAVFMRSWFCYVYVADDGVLPPKTLCETVQKVKDNWYFGVY